MKTNVTMKSEKDRELFGVVIKQDTKNCFMSLSDLDEAYTHARVMYGWSKTESKDVLRSPSNWERIFYILKEQDKLPDSIKGQICPFMEMCTKQGIATTLKKLGVYKTTGRGENRRIMCDPYIWVLVAMELNPMLYAKVVTWLTDKLILNRIEAGNFYKSLSSALYKIPQPNYPEIAKALNTKVFGKHETGIRNKGSQKQLSELTRIEDNIAYCINKGFYKTNEDVLKAINEFEVRI